MESNKKQ